MIRSGFDEQVDRLRSARTEGKSWLARIEEEEREKTGIKNLRIKFNKVFGYYLEVTQFLPGHGAGLLYPQTDADQCGALYHAGLKGAGGDDPGRGG